MVGALALLDLVLRRLPSFRADRRTQARRTGGWARHIRDMRAIERVRDALGLPDDAALGDGDVRGVARAGGERDRGLACSLEGSWSAFCRKMVVVRHGGLASMVGPPVIALALSALAFLDFLLHRLQTAEPASKHVQRTIWRRMYLPFPRYARHSACSRCPWAC